MSTGLDCCFIENEDGTWVYELEQWSRREEYDVYGPFPTFEKAREHLHANHGNPGAYSIDRYDEVTTACLDK